MKYRQGYFNTCERCNKSYNPCRRRQRWCSVKCRVLAGPHRKYETTPTEKRFWSHVKKTSTCWLWTAYLRPNGYGRIYTPEYNPSNQFVHRYSYRLHNKSFDPNLLVCHSCDVRHCVNPKHLWQGTYKDNNQDAVKKGRKPDIRGENAPCVILTEKQVLAIRSSYIPTKVTAKDLAKRYGVKPGTIYGIVFRQNWRHI